VLSGCGNGRGTRDRRSARSLRLLRPSLHDATDVGMRGDIATGRVFAVAMRE